MLSQFTREIPTHITLADLDFSFPKNVYPVGRLDADSEGLLLLSNDKKLNAKLLHPQFKQPKTYWVQVEGVPTAESLERLRKGIDIKVKGKIYRTQPAKVKCLDENIDLPERTPPIRYRKSIPDSWLSITIEEGKNRQVRKMCAAIGYPVLRLVRVQIAGYQYGKKDLREMKVGEVREVQIKL